MSVAGIIWFIFVFCLIVISHEFGHFIIAKLNGIHVVEFTIGVGPKIFGFHKNGTFYVLRWLPFGGACIFEGMAEEDLLDEAKGESKKTENGNDDSNEADEVTAADSKGAETATDSKGAEAATDLYESEAAADSDGADTEAAADRIADDEGKYGMKFNDAPVWARISTVLAGPFFNFITAYLLALVIVWFCGTDLPMVHELMEGYPAAEAGLQDGDIITKIDGSNIRTSREIYVSTMVNKSGKPMKVSYIRDGKKYETVMVPRYSEEDGRYLLGLMNYGEYIDCNNTSVFKYSFYEVRYGLVATVKCLEMLVTGKGSKDDLAGPVGMAQIIGDVEKEAKPYGIGVTILSMLNIAMLLSVNLGIMNLLPIPAIDGGRLVFLLVEAVRGKPVPPDKEGIVHLIGFVLLFALMIFVLFNDIMRIIG